NVISALNAPTSAAQPPFGASALTLLLAPCMKEGCAAVMMFCIAPHPKYFNDTLDTLSFALKARDPPTPLDAAAVGTPAAHAPTPTLQAHALQAIAVAVEPLGEEQPHSFASMVSASSVLGAESKALSSVAQGQNTTFQAPWNVNRGPSQFCD
ncbi:hypothetical protein T484DRAFT_1834301, partial [Baffinella frigidus]